MDNVGQYNDNQVSFHPGSYVEDIVGNLGITQSEFAHKLGVAPEVISKLVKAEIRLNDDLAFKLEKFTSVDYETWMNLQKVYDERMEGGVVMKVSTQALIDSYLTWFAEKMTFTELGQADEIVTPYVNHLGDRVRIYIEWLDDSTIRLSDDGLTYSELELVELGLSTDTCQKVVNEALDDFQVTQTDDGELYVLVDNISEFAQKKHNLIQAILQLYNFVKKLD